MTAVVALGLILLSLALAVLAVGWRSATSMRMDALSESARELARTHGITSPEVKVVIMERRVTFAVGRYGTWAIAVLAFAALVGALWVMTR